MTITEVAEAIVEVKREQHEGMRRDIMRRMRYITSTLRNPPPVAVRARMREVEDGEYATLPTLPRVTASPGLSPGHFSFPLENIFTCINT